MSIFTFPRQVNEHAPRVVAAGVVLLASVALASDWKGWPWLLAFGFLLRVGWGPRFSPLARFAVWLAPRFGPVVLVAGRPKRFAQTIGAVVSLSAAVLITSGHAATGKGLLVVLVGFATLESALGFCFGCWLYGRLQASGWVAADVCVDCHRAT